MKHKQFRNQLWLNLRNSLGHLSYNQITGQALSFLVNKLWKDLAPQVNHGLNHKLWCQLENSSYEET
jgi:hypothetical protein